MINEISVQEIQITPLKAKNGLCGFVNFVIDERIFIGCVAIYTSLSSPKGFRLVYPTKKLGVGNQLSIVHPIDRSTGTILEKFIIDEYLKLINNLMNEGDE